MSRCSCNPHHVYKSKLTASHLMSRHHMQYLCEQAKKLPQVHDPADRVLYQRWVGKQKVCMWSTNWSNYKAMMTFAHANLDRVVGLRAGAKMLDKIYDSLKRLEKRKFDIIGKSYFTKWKAKVVAVTLAYTRALDDVCVRRATE
mgnify:CR=1 FL=1